MNLNLIQQKILNKYTEVERNHSLYEGTYCRNLTILERHNRVLLTK